MFCPDCGNDCGNARFCSACGRELTPVEDTLVQDDLLGKFLGVDGFIAIDFCSLTVHKDTYSPPKERVVLYEDIIRVDFSRATAAQFGFLAIRIREHEHRIESEIDAAGDEMTVMFAESENGNFTQIFRYLSQVTKKQDYENRGPKQWDPTYITSGRICPRCGSHKYNTSIERPSTRVYGYLTNPSWMKVARKLVKIVRSHTAAKKIFECRNCGLTWEI